MSEPASIRFVTTAEYLAFERAAELRHELVDGEVFAMTGASLGDPVLLSRPRRSV